MERNQFSDYLYKKQQQKISTWKDIPFSRVQVIDWILRICESFQFPSKIFYQTIRLADQYYINNQSQSSDIHLIYLTSL